MFTKSFDKLFKEISFKNKWSEAVLIIIHTDRDYSAQHNNCIIIFKRYKFRNETFNFRLSSTES